MFQGYKKEWGATIQGAATITGCKRNNLNKVFL